MGMNMILVKETNSTEITSSSSIKPDEKMNMETTRNNHGERKVTGGRWSPEEDARLREIVKEHGPKNWKLISKIAFGGSRTDVQCLHRWQKVLRPGLIKGPWTQDEDKVIVNLINTYGIGNIKWSEIASNLPGRLGKQCRERWVNHLDPSLKKGPWTPEEDKVLMEQQERLGNKWRDIAVHLPGRSENAVKNRWNSARRKRKRTEAQSTTTSGSISTIPTTTMAPQQIYVTRPPPNTTAIPPPPPPPLTLKTLPTTIQPITMPQKPIEIKPMLEIIPKKKRTTSTNSKKKQMDTKDQQQPTTNTTTTTIIMKNNINDMNNNDGNMNEIKKSTKKTNKSRKSNNKKDQMETLLMNGGNIGSTTFLNPLPSSMPSPNPFGSPDVPDLTTDFSNNLLFGFPSNQGSSSVSPLMMSGFTGGFPNMLDFPMPPSINTTNSSENLLQSKKGEDFGGLQIVGTKLSNKQKQFLHEADPSSPNLPNSPRAFFKTNKTGLSHTTHEVLGMKALENLGEAEADEVFELFTFDDLVGDLVP